MGFGAPRTFSVRIAPSARNTHSKIHLGSLGPYCNLSPVFPLITAFDFQVQDPLADARGTAGATMRERLNTQAETALNNKR
jgi:hypothetical protein